MPFLMANVIEDPSFEFQLMRLNLLLAVLERSDEYSLCEQATAPDLHSES